MKLEMKKTFDNIYDPKISKLSTSSWSLKNIPIQLFVKLYVNLFWKQGEAYEEFWRLSPEKKKKKKTFP